jgi:hypothetical protein
MSLKSIKLDNIFNAIAEGQREQPEAFITFITAQTNGAIPIAHVGTYLSRDEFEEIDGSLTFASHIASFDQKTKAFRDVSEDLIVSGKMKRANVTHFQERAVGGDGRLEDPEFKINRAYFRSFGFPADSVFLNVQISSSGELVLQKRSANVVWPNTLDFAAGGAIKYPETTSDSLKNQSLEEIGLTAENADYLGQANLSFQDTEKEWTTRLTHRLFWTNISPAQMQAANFNTEEVSGYALTSPEKALLMCESGEFARPNVQSFLTSLMLSDNLPAFKGDDELKDILHQTTRPSSSLKI